MGMPKKPKYPVPGTYRVRVRVDVAKKIFKLKKNWIPLGYDLGTAEKNLYTALPQTKAIFFLFIIQPKSSHYPSLE